MKRCPFWSTELEERECFDECIMKKDINIQEECIFLEYLDSNNVKRINLNDALDEAVLELE